MENRPQHIEATSITLTGPDGRETIVNSYGFATKGPNGARLKAFIDDDGMPTIWMTKPGSRLGLTASNPPMLVVGAGNESLVLGSAGIVVRDGKKHATISAHSLGYIAQLGRDGLMTLPFSSELPERFATVKKLAANVARLFGRRRPATHTHALTLFNDKEA